MRKNALLAYIDQIYLIVAGLLLVPLFIKHLSISSYGLFGLFAIAQALFQLLDGGLAPTLTRQAARYKTGANSPRDFKLEFKVAETIFVAIAVVGATITSAYTIMGEHAWVSSPDLSHSVISTCLVLLFVTVAFRFVSSLYKGILRGFESHEWVVWISISSTSARFVLAIPVIMNSSGSPIPFFILQALVSAFELVIYRWRVQFNIPSVRVDRERLRVILIGLWNFSGPVSLLSLAWIFLTSVDRLILSHVLTLADFAKLTMALTIANVINIMASPVNTIAGPRLINLIAEGAEKAAIKLYRKLSMHMALGASSIAALLAFFGEEIVWLWVSDRDIASSVSSVVALYSFGYVLVSVSTCAWLLQFARGRLRLHVVGAIIQSLSLPIVIYVGASRYGMIGGAWAWVLIQALYFIFWLPIIHNDMNSKFHFKWLIRDILPRLIIPYLWFWGISHILVPVPNRWEQLIMVLTALASLSLPLLMMTRELRDFILRRQSEVK